jgi:hypothetical protein
MIDDERSPDDGAFSAGYTYLGQFIDHDLTFDITPLARAQPCAESIVNHRSARLDLDQLYGGGPTVSPFLYRNNPDDRGQEHFLIGPDPSKGLEYDLPRNSEGIALVGDPRDDENLIVAQLHVAFLKYHNCLIEELKKHTNSRVPNAGPAGATLFEQARRLVTWHYQYIVAEDFLRELLDSDVYKDVGPEGHVATESSIGSFRIPIEFSAAAFRFGHSMVRDSYPYNIQQNREVPLSELIYRTGVGGAVPILPADWIIDWGNFFQFFGSTRSSRQIDTKIASALHNLGHSTLRLFTAPSAGKPPPPSTFSDETPPEKVLPVITLWRGARMGLPTGQDVARAIGVEPLKPDEIAPDNGPHSKTLRHFVFDRDTPLWYYVLKEAELLGTGARLGPVGSRIVGTVIMGALRADPGSYLSVDPTWKPSLPSGAQDEMGTILAFIDPP